MIKRCLFLFILFISSLLFAQNWPADTVRGRVNTGNPKYPFPQFKGYRQGVSLSKTNAVGVTHADMEKAMREGYVMLMHRAVYTGQTYNGKRYIAYNAKSPISNPSVPGDAGGIFCSEGDGYALLAAAYFADKEAFDGLWMWIHDNRLSKVKKYYNCADLRAGYRFSKGQSLAGWQNIETTPNGDGMNDAATDGDVDIAMALLIAYKQWGDNMGTNDACGNPISYKKEAFSMITALVDTFKLNNVNGGFTGYMSGDIGIDGYVKNGNTWGETTNWRTTSTAYPWANTAPETGGGVNVPQYTDYIAPAYFHEFASFLAANGGTKWQVNQFKRAEASSDWIIGQLHAQGKIANAGQTTITGTTAAFQTYKDGEDFRTSWRTILNYVWHGNPDSTWNPATHQKITGTNSYEYDMGIRHANFLKAPKVLDGTLCSKLGASPDPSCPNWKGVAQLKQCYTPAGTVLANYGTNYALGAGTPAAVAAGDLDLTAELYRQCEIVWDDAEAKSSGMTDEQRYIKSTPKYFHDWFRLLGMLTTSGNLQAPADMVPTANMKVYMAVDKTFAYEGDLVTYTVTYRNYGTVAATGVSVTTTLDNNYEYVSSSNGGSNSGNSITWAIGSVPGFASATGISPTQGTLKFTVRVKSLTAAVNTCITSTVTAGNSESWTSNDYPNNASYTMERNCVDLLKDRVLVIKKTADRTATNGGDIVNFKVDFENKSGSNLWLNGGRNGVVVSYANFHPNNGTDFYQFYRIWHTAQEAYINLGNYRVSYFMNDAAAIGLYDAATNPTGWKTFIDNQSDLNKYGYNPLTLPANEQMKFTYQKMPWGSDANGSWNQRIVTQFANVLSSPSTHIYDKLDSDYLIHKGVKGPGFTRTRLLASPAVDLTSRLADDWSYSAAAANSALDGQAQRFFPVSPAFTDFTTKFAPFVVNNYSKDICDANVPNFSKVLVEEFDGYTWRRIAGNGPLPGRETYNVVVVDSIPAELTFSAFTNATTLGVTATYTPLTGNPKYSGFIRWTVPVMLTGEKGSLSYSASVKAISCNPVIPDKNFINAAWISSQVDSPDSSAVLLRVSCTPVPPTPPVETSLKKTANKTNVITGDIVTYSLTFTNKDGSTGQWNGTSTLVSEWKAAGTAVVPVPKTSGTTLSFDQNSNTNSGPYGLEHVKVHGKNGWIETTIDPINSSTLSYFFRHTAGTPGQTDFQGVRVEIVPNDGGNNFISLTVYDNTSPRATYTGANKLSFGGTSDPIKLRVELLDGVMYIWANDFTGAPLKVISGILNQNPGYTGIFASGSQQAITAWKGHFDSAFDLIMSDAVPVELNNIKNISNSGSVTAGTVSWLPVPGPILASDPPIVRTFEATVNTCANFITNIGKASVYGVSNIQSQNVVKCGGSSCSFTTAGLTPAGPINVCAGQNVTLTASTNGTSNIRYQLYNASATVGTVQTSAAFTITANGNYKVRAFDNADPTCFAESPVVIVTFSPLPLAPSVTSPQTFCKNATGAVLIAAPAVNNQLVWYTSDVPAVTGQTTITPAVNTSLAGTSTYYIAQRTIAAPNCESTTRMKLDVVVTDSPIATITTTGAALRYCEGANGVTLTATPVSNATFEWFKAGQSQGTASTSNTFANAASGDWTVKVTSGTCPATSSVATVSVNPLPAVNIIPTVAQCGGTVDLNALSSAPGTRSFYSDTLTSPVANAVVSLSGTYYLQITDQQGCKNKFINGKTDVTIKTVPTADISPKNPGYCGTDGAQLTASGAGPGATYEWFKGGNSMGAPSLSNILPNATTGNYTVKVTSSENCSSTSTPSVTVSATTSLVPALDISSPLKVCENTPVNVNISSQSSGNVEWFEDGVSKGIASSYTLTPTKNVQIKAILTSSEACANPKTASDSVNITVDKIPSKANITSTPKPVKEVCTSSVSMDATIPVQGTGSWFLNAGSPGLISPGGVLSAIPNATFIKVYYKVVNGTCPQSVDSIYVKKADAPATIDVHSQSRSICYDASYADPLLTAPAAKAGETATWEPAPDNLGSISGSGQTSNLKAGKNKFYYRIKNNTCNSIFSLDSVTITLDTLPKKPNAGGDKEICSSDFRLEAVSTSQQIKWSTTNSAITFDSDTDYNTFARNLPLNTPSLLILSATNGACKVPVNDTVSITSIGTLTQAKVKHLSGKLCEKDIPPVLTGNPVNSGEIAAWSSLNSGVTIDNSGKISNISIGKNQFVYSISGNVCPGITRDTVTIDVLVAPEAFISLPVQNNGTYKTQATFVSLQAVMDAPEGYNAKWEISGQGTLSAIPGALNSLGDLTVPGTTKVMWIMAENSNTCRPDTAFIYVQKLPPNFVDAGKDTTVCETSLPVLKGNGSEPGVWKALTSQTSIVQNGAQATVTSASVTQVNKYSYCIATSICDTVEIKVNQASNPSVSIMSPSLSNCPGDSVILKIDQISPQNTSLFTYQWLKNGTVIPNGTSETFTTTAWQNGDAFSLKIKAINRITACLKIDSALSASIPFNAVSVITPLISVYSDTTLLNCESDTVRFGIKTQQGQGAFPKYSWLVNNKEFATDSVLILTSWKTGDQVSLKMKSSQSCAVPDTTSSNKIILKGTTRQDKSIGLSVSGLPIANMVCRGTQLTLKAESALADLIYEWSDGVNTYSSPSITAAIQVATNYSLKVKSKPGCYLSGDSLSENTSFIIRVTEPININLIYDSSGNCKDSLQNFKFSSPGIISSYNWYVNDIIQPGRNTNSEDFGNLNHHDIVKVEAVSTPACNSGLNKTSDTARANVYAKPQTGFVNIDSEQLTICSSTANVQLTPTESDPGYTYTWTKNGTPAVAQGNMLAYQGDGTYKLIIQNNSCSTTSSVNIKTEDPVVKIITDKVEFVVGETVTADAFGLNNQKTSYYWTPAAIADPANQKQTTLFPVETFMLKVVAVVNDCIASDSILIKKKDKLFIPNAIIPGTDGINGFWGIKGAENYPSIDIKVFNRWGSLVYQQKGYNTPWDGTLNGKELPTGTYYYVIKDDQLTEPMVGDLTIIR